MKKSIIREMFNGFRGTAEQMKMTQEEDRLMSVISETYDELIRNLTPEQIVLYLALSDAQEKEWIEEADNHYVEGFKFGLLIGIECMEEH